MPIGETLAQARHQAGLTVAQVSQQTRIRGTIIRNIEEGDYSECGGDFYARGHIRAIAKAVGADPGPLIQEYDARHRAPGAIGAVSLDELLAASPHAARRRRADRHAARTRAPARRRTVHWAALVGLALAVVVLGFVALRLLAGGPRAAAPSAAGTPAATARNAGHGRPGPAAKASHPPAVAPAPAPRASPSGAPAPTPAQPARPAPQARPLAPVRATAFGPNGGDNPS